MLNRGGAFHDLSLPIRLGLQTLMQAFRPLLLLSFLCLSFSDSKNFILIFSDSIFLDQASPLTVPYRVLFWFSFFSDVLFWISMDLQCFSDSRLNDSLFADSQIALFSCSRSFHIFSDFQILHSLRFCVILDLQYLFSCVYFKSFEMSPCFRLPSLHSDFVLSLSPAFLNSYNMTCVLGLGVAPGIPSYSTRRYDQTDLQRLDT
jgi:hypothetical protein